MPTQLPQNFNARTTKPFIFKSCSVASCFEVVKAKGLCNKHLQRQFKNKNILKRSKLEQNEIEILSDCALIHLYNNKGDVIAKAIIDIEDVERVKLYVWSKEIRKPYVFNSSVGKLHHFIMNSKEMYDHKDTNPLNNRKQNLRPCSKCENNRNRSKSSNNTSGAKGVSWFKLNQKFEAYINVNNKKIHLGLFLNVIEAAISYNKAAIKYFGEFACLNNIEALKLQCAVTTSKGEIMFPQGFSARQVEPAGQGGQLPVSPPEGWVVVINGHEMVAVKDKPQDGRCVFNIQIIDGAAKGTEGSYGLNLFSSSEQAAKIAQQELSALCHVTRKLDAVREEELYNIPFRMVVEAQKGEGKEGYTRVRKILDTDGNAPGKQATGPAPGPVAGPTAAPGAKPWETAAPAPEQTTQTQWGGATTTAGAAAPPWAQK